MCGHTSLAGFLPDRFGCVKPKGAGKADGWVVSKTLCSQRLCVHLCARDLSVPEYLLGGGVRYSDGPEGGLFPWHGGFFPQ